jgi:transposase
VLRDLLSEVSHLDERIKQYDKHIHAMAKDCTAAQQLMQLMGVGETTATAIVAMVGDARASSTAGGWPPRRCAPADRR